MTADAAIIASRACPEQIKGMRNGSRWRIVESIGNLWTHCPFPFFLLLLNCCNSSREGVTVPTYFILRDYAEVLWSEMLRLAQRDEL